MHFGVSSPTITLLYGERMMLTDTCIDFIGFLVKRLHFSGIHVDNGVLQFLENNAGASMKPLTCPHREFAQNVSASNFPYRETCTTFCLKCAFPNTRCVIRVLATVEGLTNFARSCSLRIEYNVAQPLRTHNLARSLSQ